MVGRTVSFAERPVIKENEPLLSAADALEAEEIDDDAASNTDADDDEDDSDDEDEPRSRIKLFKNWKPSPYYLWVGTFIYALSLGACMAPKLEIYTLLVCRSQMPADKASYLPAQSWYQLDPEQCRHDSHVQKRVAALNTAMTLCMGILGAITTGQYGSLSDRYGRTLVMGASLLGSVINDAVFLTTVTFADTLSYRFLLLGPIIDGLLGGIATAQATMNSYISDCTPAGSRARVFSVVMGLLFAGFGMFDRSYLRGFELRWQ